MTNLLNSETLITIMLVTLVIGIFFVVVLMLKDIFCTKEVSNVNYISSPKNRFAKKYTNK